MQIYIYIYKISQCNGKNPLADQIVLRECKSWMIAKALLESLLQLLPLVFHQRLRGYELEFPCPPVSFGGIDMRPSSELLLCMASLLLQMDLLSTAASGEGECIVIDWLSVREANILYLTAWIFPYVSACRVPAPGCGLRSPAKHWALMLFVGPPICIEFEIYIVVKRGLFLWAE